MKKPVDDQKSSSPPIEAVIDVADASVFPIPWFVLCFSFLLEVRYVDMPPNRNCQQRIYDDLNRNDLLDGLENRHDGEQWKA